jgi:hypothetical protein
MATVYRGTLLDVHVTDKGIRDIQGRDMRQVLGCSACLALKLRTTLKP